MNCVIGLFRHIHHNIKCIFGFCSIVLAASQQIFEQKLVFSNSLYWFYEIGISRETPHLVMISSNKKKIMNIFKKKKQSLVKKVSSSN
ncbi:hypothetical protein BpHYR1_023791 [Brachionus plicatilis]|uniref:Uncharacterized protein n=1 Tax=Brachionus plicatilis TaxID=10195 RepID=A0A3M7QHS4_BRAPC|nr:hypothetical protein BpHYR1_023791 [Brachionus plicatilis]